MGELIYNQREIPKDTWRYGLRSSAATGCGWIAAYNALQLMGYQVDPERLIRHFERSTPLINGNLGTFLPDPVVFFRKNGFHVSVTARRNTFDEAARSSDACILLYYWHQKYKLGTHFAALHYTDGKFVGYNTFRNSSGPDNYGASLEEFIKKQRFFCPVLISIRDRRRPEKDI